MTPRRPTCQCLQCSLQAILNDLPVPLFDGTLVDHMTKFHPDPVDAYREKQAIQSKLAVKWGLLGRRKGDTLLPDVDPRD